MKYYARFNPQGFSNTGEWMAFKSREERNRACEQDNAITPFTRKQVRDYMRACGEKYSFNVYLGSLNCWEETNRRYNSQNRLSEFFCGDRP